MKEKTETKTGKEIDREVLRNIKRGVLAIVIITVIYFIPIHAIPKYSAMLFIFFISIKHIFLSIGAFIAIVIGIIGPIGED